jgi:hypothetical protein
VVRVDAVGVRTARLAAIQAELRSLGPVLPGSFGERRTRCANPGCHCRADPPLLHGPYPTWTRRVAGRQVTRTLTDDEALRLRPMIEASRRLRELVVELQALGLEEAQALLAAARRSSGGTTRRRS